ncbi:MAG: hypothetical protein ABIL58_16100 [Pseudomonadota bacterium]
MEVNAKVERRIQGLFRRGSMADSEINCFSGNLLNWGTVSNEAGSAQKAAFKRDEE